MATPVGGVSNGGNPYAGGTLSRAGRPTGLTAEFATPGAPGFPTPGQPGILTARNNRGSNVRIPYSRLVPMHGKDKLPVLDTRGGIPGVTEMFEYDGLEGGELAWVMGKQFSAMPRGIMYNYPTSVSSVVNHTALLHNIDGATNSINAIAAAWRASPMPPGHSTVGGRGPVDPAGGLLVYPDSQTAAARGRAWTGWVDSSNQPVLAPAHLTPGGRGGMGPDGAVLLPNGGGGYGVDRMQRMASTGWVESWFHRYIATQRIDLVGLRVADEQQQNAFLDGDIAYFSALRTIETPAATLGANAGVVQPERAASAGYLDGATVLCGPDLAYALQCGPVDRNPASALAIRDPDPQRIALGSVADPMRMQVQVPMMQGLFLMEKGPFLRSYGVEHYPVDIRLPNDTHIAGGNRVRRWNVMANPRDPADPGAYAQTPKLAEVDRHLGSQLAHKALYCELKKHGVFNWTPDGMCLSKFATGPDGYADDTFDARTGQLFNIGVQGPCITKTWAGDSSMVAMPGDKLFVLVIGTINYEVGDTTDAQDARPVFAEAAPPAAPGVLAPLPNEGLQAAGDRNQAQKQTSLALDAMAAAQATEAGGAGIAPTRANLERAVRGLHRANAALTMGISRERFVRQQAYDAPNQSGARGMVGTTVARPNAARYLTSSDVVGAVAERRANGAAASGKQLARAVEEFTKQLSTAPASRTAVSELHENLVVALDQLASNSSPSVLGAATYEALRAQADSALKAYQSLYGTVARGNVAISGAADSNEFTQVAEDVRNGRRQVVRAEISGVHLKRATSSWMSNTSHFDPMEGRSRCGLHIGYMPDAAAGGGVGRVVNTVRASQPVDPGGGPGSNFRARDLDAAGAPAVTRETYYDNAANEPTAAQLQLHPHAKPGMRSDAVNGLYAQTMPMPDIDVGPSISGGGLTDGSIRREARTGVSEFILGAWCVGTVMDSAASRAATAHGNVVRTAQHSMAMNVNVNVEWWDGDKLYQHYMDRDRGHFYAQAEDPRVTLARKKAEGIPSPLPAALQPKMVMHAEGTVKQRNESSMRTVETMVREYKSKDVQSMRAAVGTAAAVPGGVAPAVIDVAPPGEAAVPGGAPGASGSGFGLPQGEAVFVNPPPATANDTLTQLAVRRITTGEGEYEGVYVQPAVDGVDSDPVGTRIYDLRARRDIDFGVDGYVASGTDAQAPAETLVSIDRRYWWDTLADI